MYYTKNTVKRQLIPEEDFQILKSFLQEKFHLETCVQSSRLIYLPSTFNPVVTNNGHSPRESLLHKWTMVSSEYSTRTFNGHRSSVHLENSKLNKDLPWRSEE